jgi:hypothetical protein
MSVSPAATAATTPALLTVATPSAEDCQVAWLVTDCVVPFESVAVAVNCALPPMLGVEPLIATEETVGAAGVVLAVVEGAAGVLLLPPHDHNPIDNEMANAKADTTRRIVTLHDGVRLDEGLLRGGL